MIRFASLNYIFMKYFFVVVFIILFGCQPDDNLVTNQSPSVEWTFVACEGNYGASNGSITLINNLGEIKSVDNVGDVVQSIEVYKNKLFVIVNNSHKIRAYDITKEGLSLPGIEVSTNNSSPREMKIINDKLYFTNWNSSDVKVLNLINYVIEDSIKVDGKPESILVDGTDLWVGIQLNNDFSDGNKLLKIDTKTNSITSTHEIGKGPTSLTMHGNKIYIANTFYDKDYNAFYGSSRLDKIDQEIDINYYGSGIVCGGDVLNYSNKIFRSFSGGAAILDEQLNILENTKIGDYESSKLYSSEIIGDYIYFGLTNYTDYNKVKVVDFNNNEVGSFDVGIIPGDFAYWKSN